jgi:hypothetical protein
MFIGALLTYALFNGLFRGTRPPQPPEKERVAAIVAELMQVLTAR